MGYQVMEEAEKLPRALWGSPKLGKSKAPTTCRLKDKRVGGMIVTHGLEFLNEDWSWWTFLEGAGTLKVMVATTKDRKRVPWSLPSFCPLLCWRWLKLGNVGSIAELRGTRARVTEQGQRAIQVVFRSRDGLALNFPGYFSCQSLALTVLILWDSQRKPCSGDVRAPLGLKSMTTVSLTQ